MVTPCSGRIEHKVSTRLGLKSALLPLLTLMNPALGVKLGSVKSGVLCNAARQEVNGLQVKVHVDHAARCAARCRRARDC